jgi:hypothetical protein
MSFLKNILGKEDPIRSYADFWQWFEKNERRFHRVVSRNGNVEKEFFDKISPKLEELGEGYFYLTGMADDHTVELILTADGNLKKMIFVEELVNAAPSLPGWKFVAHKPPLNIENVSIHMQGYDFSCENLSFYANEDPLYPDEIDIVIVHHAMTEKNKQEITNGVYIFLDNYLGEIDFVTNVDVVNVVPKENAARELIPIQKLRAYLTWRQKEFVERYEGKRYNTDNDEHSVLEAIQEDGTAMIAAINADLIAWDAKASHPWIAVVAMKFDGSENNGMPDDTMFELLDQIEEDLLSQLQDFEGYLNVGRQTSKDLREVYFACRDFRKPSKVIDAIIKKYSDRVEMDFELYSDKYWKTFERFSTAIN